MAGAAWVTPSVLTRDQASAYSGVCGATQTMAWPTASGITSPPGGNAAATSFSNWDITLSGVKVRVSFTTGGGVVRRGQGIATLGNVAAADNFQINKDAAPLNADATIQLDFVDPVTNAARSVGDFDVTLLDVDKSCNNSGGNGTFTDQVIVAATLNAAAVTPTTVTLNNTFVTQSPAGTFTGISDASGTGNTGGNVRLQYTGKFITRITFTYRSAQAVSCGGGNCGCSPGTNRASTDQYFGINEFTFC